jgi:hypothetical protein
LQKTDFTPNKDGKMVSRKASQSAKQKWNELPDEKRKEFISSGSAASKQAAGAPKPGPAPE